jgi:hypothetical protein
MRLPLGMRGSQRSEHIMLDLFMLAIGIGFFVLALGYARACEWL